MFDFIPNINGHSSPMAVPTTVVSKAHRPGNAIMMVVNGLAPKGTSTSVNTIVNFLQFLCIQVHSNHVTQRTYHITAINSLRPSDACMCE